MFYFFKQIHNNIRNPVSQFNETQPNKVNDDSSRALANKVKIQSWNEFQAAFRKLAVAYHSIFLKKMLHFPRNTSNSLLFVSYGVPTLQELIRKRIFSLKIG